MANSTTGDSVLERLDRVLGAFSAADDLLSGAEITRRTSLPPATVHRLCHAMARHDWLQARPGGFGIGTRLWEVSNRSAQTTRWAVRARPFLTDIHAVIGQHVQLGVVEGHEVLFVDRLSTHRAPRIHGGVADRLPLHRSATGTVLLAHASPAFRQSYRQAVTEAVTEDEPSTTAAQRDTDADPAPLTSEARLEQVRQEGYCAQTGAIEPHITGVAVPIRGRGREVVAGLGVVTDAEDVAQRPAPWVQLLQIAARGIRREMRAVH